VFFGLFGDSPMVVDGQPPTNRWRAPTPRPGGRGNNQLSLSNPFPPMKKKLLDGVLVSGARPTHWRSLIEILLFIGGRKDWWTL
jgi:hypothetical protein